MEETSRPEKLRQENAQRWKTLQQIHEQCHHHAETITTTSTAARYQSRALEVELDMLQSLNHCKRRNVNFPQELVMSYDDLRQTNAVLDRCIEREKEKFQAMKQLVSQHKAVHQALQSMRNSNNHESPSRNVSDSERQNQWIRNELCYVSNQIQEQQRRKKRRRLEQETNRREEESTWGLDRFVLELTERYLASSLDPYLLLNSLPIETWQIDFLKQCSVLRMHPDNSDLVCLSDYNGNSSTE